MELSNNQQAFLELVRAGLWEKDAHLLTYGEIDFKEIYRLAQEQAVLGLVAAGLEHVKDFNIPQEMALTFAGEILQLEQQNKSMNDFIAMLIDKMRVAGIYSLLIKGQGIAQCYERPLWRACGDIDLLLSKNNYEQAKLFVAPLGELAEPEEAAKCHFAIQIKQWPVELHGTFHGGLSHSIDKILDDVQDEVFFGGNVRSWMNNRTQVFLPGVNCDVVYIFLHIIQHFYKGGVGMRQICDWSRLLWTYRSNIDKNLLEQRLRKMKVMSEWKAFGSFAVNYLGFPKEEIPFYDTRYRRKSLRILKFIMEVGNFGHNRDTSFYSTKPYFSRKCLSAWRRVKDSCRHFVIFPIDSLRFFFGIMYNGIVSAIRGE